MSFSISSTTGPEILCVSELRSSPAPLPESALATPRRRTSSRNSFSIPGSRWPFRFSCWVSCSCRFSYLPLTTLHSAAPPFRAGHSPQYAVRSGRLGGALVAKGERGGIISPPKMSYPAYFFNSGCVDHTAAHGSLQDSRVRRTQQAHFQDLGAAGG